MRQSSLSSQGYKRPPCEKREIWDCLSPTEYVVEFMLLNCFKRIRRPHRKSLSGATAVEMALIAPTFFLLLMGTVEMALIETAQQLLENAAYNTSRLAKTGYTQTGMSQAQTVSQEMVNELQGFSGFIDTTQVTMTDVAYNGFANIGSGTGTNGMGVPDQIVVYTISYPWKIFTPMIGQLVGALDGNGDWIINLTARIVVRNEPYT
jgi:Flp pilus assembly protein TadG